MLYISTHMATVGIKGLKDTNLLHQVVIQYWVCSTCSWWSRRRRVTITHGHVSCSLRLPWGLLSSQTLQPSRLLKQISDCLLWTIDKVTQGCICGLQRAVYVCGITHRITITILSFNNIRQNCVNAMCAIETRSLQHYDTIICHRVAITCLTLAYWNMITDAFHKMNWIQTDACLKSMNDKP